MSCCGTVRPQATDKSLPAIDTRFGGGTLQQQQFPVSQQPTAHPHLEISPFPPPTDASSSFLTPDITPPPLAYPGGQFNGSAHSPPLTVSTAPSPPPGMYSSASPVLDPNGPLTPLRRPSPTYPTSRSSNPPNLLSTYQSSTGMPSLPPIDEGKMSVSIDFGERHPF